MKEILWLSRHRPLPRQYAELRRLFGEVLVHHDADAFASAEDIKKRFDKGGYDDIVVVAPLWVIAHLLNLGIKPLYAQMDEVKTAAGAEVTVRRLDGLHYFRFNRFRRLIEVELKFEELEPELKPGKED